MSVNLFPIALVLFLCLGSLLGQSNETTPAPNSTHLELTPAEVNAFQKYTLKSLEGDWHFERMNLVAFPDSQDVFRAVEGKLRGHFYYDKKHMNLSFYLQFIEGNYNDERTLTILFREGKFKRENNTSGALRIDFTEKTRVIYIYKGMVTSSEDHLTTSLSIEFNNFLFQDGPNIDITLKAKFVKNHTDIDYEDNGVKVYNIAGSLNLEPSTIISDYSFMGLFVLFAMIKIASARKIIRDLEQFGVGSKLSFPGQVLLTLCDYGIMVYFRSSQCDYEKIPFTFVIISSFLYGYIFGLDLVLCQLIFRGCRDARRNTESNQRPSLIWGRIPRMVKLVMAFCIGFIIGFYSARIVVETYPKFDYLKLVYSLFLVPQIIENAVYHLSPYENTKAIIGNSVYSLLILYHKLVPSGYCHLEPAYVFSLCYLVLFVFQSIIIILQARWGPRFFIPAFLLKRFSKAHRYLVEIDEEEVDGECIICLAPLTDIPLTTPDPSPNVARILRELRPTERQIMKTPCGHRYHVTCLVSWIVNKPDCPICRDPLNPLI